MALRRLLILTAHTGAGHYAAAAALAQAAQASGPPPVEAAVLDAFDAGALQAALAADAGRRNGRWATDAYPPPVPSVVDRLSRVYAPLIVRAPWLWGWLFRASNNELGPRVVSLLGGKGVTARIAQAINALRPDALVVAHPLLTYPAAEARRQGADRHDLPLTTVVTDLVTVHRVWVCPQVDHFVVGSPYAGDAVMDRGIPPSRVHRLGVPVRPQFASLNVPAREMRARLELDHDRPVVLIMGGGEGAGPMYAVATALAAQDRSVQLLVVTGRNVGLRRRLEGRSWTGTMRALGFVETIPELMLAADVIVTKPGSLTIAEACAIGRPLVLLPPVPGQEDGNVAYVVDAEAGLAASGPGEAAEAVRFLLASPAERWEMGQRAARLGQPRAAQRTLAFVEGLMLAAEARRR